MKLLKLYKLARSHLTQHEKSNIAQFLLLCPALRYSAMGHHEKARSDWYSFGLSDSDATGTAVGLVGVGVLLE